MSVTPPPPGLYARNLYLYQSRLGRRVLDRVYRARHTALLKLHHVPRQRASFVREHVLHHAELFVQVGGARHCRCVRFRVVHIDVHVDEDCLRAALGRRRKQERISNQVTSGPVGETYRQGQVIPVTFAGALTLYTWFPQQGEWVGWMLT